jgi:hypothetical protein
MMNPAVALALILDLYEQNAALGAQVQALSAENEGLRKRLGPEAEE